MYVGSESWNIKKHSIFCLYDVISGVKFQNEVVLETVSERGVSEEGL